MANIPDISVAPEAVFTIGGFAVSNSVISSLAILVGMAIFFMMFKSRLKLIPGRLQVFMEMIVDFFYSSLIDAYRTKERARKYLSLIVSLFLFVLIANQFTVIPLIQSITIDDGTFLFRNPTAHFSLPIALALIVFFISHFVAFSIAPKRHIQNFFKLHLFFKVRSFKDLANAFLENFLAFLDIVGELAKIVSLSARLFGNVFAGVVMVGVITGLTYFIVPAPFWFLSIFSGLIQALVFAILAMAFISGMAKSVEDEPEAANA